MILGKVVGNIVSSHKDEGIDNIKLLLVELLEARGNKLTGKTVVASDSVGAGIGEVVMLVTGSSARMTETTKGRPSDATIMAIIDLVTIDGDVTFDKSKS